MSRARVARARSAVVAGALLAALICTALTNPAPGEGQSSIRVGPLPLLGADGSAQGDVGLPPAPAERRVGLRRREGTALRTVLERAAAATGLRAPHGRHGMAALRNASR